MELKELFDILKKRLILIILITLVATSTVGLLSYFVIKPKYKADISVIIGKTQSEVSNSSSNYYDVMLYQTMVKTYSKLTISRAVAQDVIKKLDLQSMNVQSLKLESMKLSDLLDMVTVTPDQDTQFLTITVLSNQPKLAMNIANQFALSLKEISIKINKVDIVMVIDMADLPTVQYSPKPLVNIGITIFLGVLLSVGIAFLLEYLDNTIKTKEDVEIIVGLPVIGMISLVKIKHKEEVLY